MAKQNQLYDVYVSYPPNVDVGRINACLYDNLPEIEAESLIQALSERPQAIIAENCSHEERENARQYFNYMGLDVIVRQSLELTPQMEEEEREEAPAAPTQCPVCLSIPDSSEEVQCRTCHFHFASTDEQTIRRKRIEWQEKIAFEHKRQAEIEQRLAQEKALEEKRLRQQIREKLDKELKEELGDNPLLTGLQAKRKNILLVLLVMLLIILLVSSGYLAAKYL